MLAAEATERVRLGTFVLYAALLAREVASTDEFADGRLELGLGAGYVKAEFDTAGLPWRGAGKCLDHLEHTINELRRLFADPEHQPHPAQKPGPPLLIGGWGDRMLRLAAEHADIRRSSSTCSCRWSPSPTTEPARSSNCGVMTANLTVEELGALPTLLVGTPR